MGIAEILAAEALLHLRGTGVQCPKTYTFQDTEDLGMSARLSRVTVDESSSSMTMEDEGPTTRRKRTRSCTSESSDQSVSDETLEPVGNNVIRIGDGNATVPVEMYTSIKWDSYTMATRKLLSAVFPCHILATHSLSGNRSPAFPDKAAKQKLDPKLVNDIVKTVAEKCGVPENVVRKAIYLYICTPRDLGALGRHYISSPRNLGALGKHYISLPRDLGALGRHYISSLRDLGALGRHYISSPRNLGALGKHYISSPRNLGALGKHYISLPRDLGALGRHTTSLHLVTSVP
ncbi:unnamed protein product [Pieris macdunnoughi]|uniref:BEN domain-containing protein n=1 Tax=Pieris macdunnoughi TaxID=345717 RepID=A0A821U093_9NEOP|nr:unnamed protein product [Pieris macdunnoughi]